MAVAPMKKIGVIGYLPLEGDIINTLQEYGMVQVDLSEEAINAEAVSSRTIANVKSSLDFLKQFFPKLPPKPILTKEQFIDIVQKNEPDEICSEIDELQSQRDELMRSIAAIRKEQHELHSYLSLPYSGNEMKGTAHTTVFIGFVEQENIDNMERELNELPPLFEIQTVHKTHTGSHIVLIAHNSIAANVEEILVEQEFVPLHFAESADTPAEHYRELDDAAQENENSLDDIEHRIVEIAPDRIVRLRVLLDHLSIGADRERAASSATSTNKTFFLTGWVKTIDYEDMEKMLLSKCPVADIVELTPEPDESPPVALENPGWLKPFEVITDMYGRPRKGMIDPTPWTVPFFALFFAFCLTDAGYGLMLAVGALLALIFLKKIASGVRNFIKLVLYMGILTIIAGAMAGSWWGMNPSNGDPNNPFVKAALSVKLFDPLDNALLFFAITVFFGIVQISVGFALSAYVKIKSAESVVTMVKEIVVGLSWIGITIGLGLYINYNLIPQSVEHFVPLSLMLLQGGVVGVVIIAPILGITSGQKIGPAIAGAIGFDGLYGVIGVFGDIISYARILALGISTGVIAGVIDSLAGILAGSSIATGIIAAIFLVAGHIFYVAMSSLSAFVHPLRLQYVEYFGKFYESGGSNFTPLTREFKNVSIE